MDFASPPYADPGARLQALYRLPMSGQERHLAVIGDREDSDSVFGRALRERVRVISPEEALRSNAVEAFDVVALPGVLSRRGESDSLRVRPPSSALQLIKAAHRMLVRGGLLVGHCEQFSSVLGRGRLVQFGWIRWGDWESFLRLCTACRCQQTLENLGFVAVECYLVEPGMHDPMAIVQAGSLAARRHYINSIHRDRHRYTLGGYLARDISARMGWAGLLQPHFMFWARRSC